MLEKDLKSLVLNIKNTKCESQTIELKKAFNNTPSKLYDTLSSFSNQTSGGTIIFGIDEENDYEICGVYDPQDLQKKVTEQCKEMEPVVRPLFTVCSIDDKIIVSCEVPGIDIYNRPVFYKGHGRLKGSYVRVGDSDEHMTEYEIYSYEAFRKHIRDDIRIVESEDNLMIDEIKLAEYLEATKMARPNLALNVSDSTILELMGVKKGNYYTLAGFLVFSKYPQSHFPQLSITAVRYPDDNDNSNIRFLDNSRITGSISDMLEYGIDFVVRNSKKKTIINSNGKRVDQLEYPTIAIREVILNALIHRDYSIHSENIPITIEMFSNRIEITNNGGLYGRVSIDDLGYVKAETRNSTLVNILELLNVTENRYSGIPTIRNELKKHNLPQPVFKNYKGEFKVIIYNDLSCVDEETALLDFCEEARSREEIVNFIGKSKNFVISKIVMPLVQEGKLEMTMPDKPKSPYQKYKRK